MDIKERNQKLL